MKKQPRRNNSIRKKFWDYRTPAYYFITICTHQRQYYFENPAIKLLAETIWRQITTYDSCDHIALDSWVVMPNHVHLLFYLGESTEFLTVPFDDTLMPRSVGAVMGTYKKIVGRKARRMLHSPSLKFWQRGYYDRIVRNEEELNRIRHYIEMNPTRWVEDSDDLDSVLAKMDYHDL